MIQTPFLARQEHFAVVGSTNDVVRGWLAAGEPEVCLAVAEEQSAGRGREGRTWSAPAGRALLMSLGFRPTWLAPDRVWRLAAVTSLAMADAAEAVADLPAGSVRLKWPNDLVVEVDGVGIRKLAGVLGSFGLALGTDLARKAELLLAERETPGRIEPAELLRLAAGLRALVESRGAPANPTN